VDWAKPETIPGMPPIGALTAADQPGVVSGHIVMTNRRHAPQSRKLAGTGDPRTFPKDKYSAVGFSLTNKSLADVVLLSGGKYGVIAKWRSDDRAFAAALDQRCTEIIREAYDPALEALTRAGWGQQNVAARGAKTSDAEFIAIAESLGISTSKRGVGAKQGQAAPQRSGRLSSARRGISALSLSRDPAGPRPFPRPPSVAPPGFADAYLYGDRLFQRLEARAKSRREEARRARGDSELNRIVSVEARVTQYILANRLVSPPSDLTPSILWEWAERLDAALVDVSSSSRMRAATIDIGHVLRDIDQRLRDMGIERPNE
jgi:hypothetical protein